MPLILNRTTPRRAFQFGRRSALRAADELVDQLAEQLQLACREIAQLRVELARERHAAATRKVADAFQRLERNPDTVLH
jgi:hypothetical protein